MADFYEQNRQRGRVESSTGAMYSAPPPVPPPPRPTLLLPLLCCTGSRVETEDAAVGLRDRGAIFWVRAGDGQIEKQQGGAVVFVGKGGRKGKEKRNRMDWRCGESKGCLQRAATCFGGEDLR